MSPQKSINRYFPCKSENRCAAPLKSVYTKSGRIAPFRSDNRWPDPLVANGALEATVESSFV